METPSPFPARAWRILIAASLLLALLDVLLGVHRRTNWPPIRSDGEGYYAYLPLAFVHHSADASLVEPWQEDGHKPAGSWQVPATGHWHIKYPMGVALFAAPFFLLAHAFCSATGAWPADGYSLPYEIAVLLAGTAAFAAGTWALGRFLCRRFSSPAAAAALLLVGLGTNLVHYATFDACFSHIYSFLWLALLLDGVDRFALAPSTGRAALLGLFAGLGFLTRNYSVLFASFFLVPLLQLRVAPAAWLRGALVAGFTGLAVIAPQLALWKYSTGSILTYSYGDEGFTHLAHPLFGKVFFSWEKGAFLYYPILLVFLAGLAAALGDRARRIEAAFALAAFAVLGVIVSSWSSWQYGSSLGHRAFVDLYPLLALGGGWLAQRALDRGWRRGLTAATAVSITYAVLLMGAYWFHLLKMDGMDRARFLQLPGRMAYLPVKVAGVFYQIAVGPRADLSGLPWTSPKHAELHLPPAR